jgi:hypothetical protein
MICRYYISEHNGDNEDITRCSQVVSVVSIHTFSNNVSIKVIYSYLIIGTQKLGMKANMNIHTRNVLPDNLV